MNEICVHHDLVRRIIINDQNIRSAKIQFIGDKCGIIKSPLVIETWQVSVICLTRF